MSKQPDVVMLFYLFAPAEIREVLERLGYEYRHDTAARNIAYYDERTSHGSTLSFVTFAAVLAPLDPESSWERSVVALRSDVQDIQAGTTREGIHMGVMSGTVDLMQRAYPGTEMRDGVLRFQPRLPAAVEQIAFRMQFQRTPLQVTLDHERLAISIQSEGAGGPIRVGVGDDVRELCPGDTETFELSSPVAEGGQRRNP